VAGSITAAAGSPGEPGPGRRASCSPWSGWPAAGTDYRITLDGPSTPMARP
jgi:hypothetical protein